MGETTAISWCDATFNPWIGCTKVSPACDGCYAEALMDKRYGRVEWGAPGKGNGTRVRTSAGYWHQPLRWNKRADADGSRPFVFCASLADVFDNQVPPAWRADLFQLIRATPRLVWLLLSKRPQKMVELTEDAGGLPPNVALGTTCEDQRRWDLNIGELANAKAVLHPRFAFVSIEPMLGEINPRRAHITPSMRRHLAWSGRRNDEFFDPIHPRQDPRFRLDWIITGGETDQGGHRARPWNPQWARDLRDDCSDTGTAYHHKQNGEWVSVSEVEGPGEHFVFPDGRTVRRVGAKRAGRLLDGIEHNARPSVPEIRP